MCHNSPGVPCPPPNLPRDGAAPWRRSVALFLVVAGARFWLVAHYALPLPYWDQWDAIGAGLLKPWMEGRLDLSALFAAHNEHRIVLTRLLSLGLFAANGQWDGTLEMAVNALGCGVGAVALAQALTRAAGGGSGRLIYLATGGCWALPFGWENTLGGFQSQNYFLIFFSLLAIWGLTPGAAGSARWLLGVAGLALAGLSMASGFLAAVAVLAMGGARLAAGRRRPKRGELVTAGLCALAVAAGWMARVDVAANAGLKAESATAFLGALGRFLAWPWYGLPLGAAVAIGPTLALGWRYLRDAGARPGSELLLTISGWCILQTAALAYGRGGHAAPPACRYMDLLAVGPLVNFVIGLALAGDSPTWRGRGAVAVWTALLLAGLALETRKDFTIWLPDFRAQMQRSEANAAGYVRTGDFARCLAGRTVRDLPYPDPARLAALLDDATLRPLFPADLRQPVTLAEVARSNPAAFPSGGSARQGGLPVGLPTWASFAADGQGTMRARGHSASGLPYLVFYFSGDLGEEGLRFQLLDGDGRPGLDWRPGRPARDRWHAEVLPSRGRDFQVVATDASPWRRFAFSAPTEMGFWSRWAGFALRRGGAVLLAGLGLAMAGGAARGYGALRASSPRSAADRTPRTPPASPPCR